MKKRKCPPLEKEEVEVIEFLCQEVSKDSCRVATTELIRRQSEVDALEKIPELGHWVMIEHPVKIKEMIYSLKNI